MKTKKCFTCNKVKFLSEFHKHSSHKDGYHSQCKECRKKYHNKNRNQILQYQKQYRENNIEYFKKQNKKWREENKIKYKKYSKEYRKKYQQRRNKLRNKRYYIDIRFRLETNLRNRIGKALKYTNKSLNTIFLIGCEVDYLIFHIQNQFKRGMNWDNHSYRGWHVDHIKPLDSFNLSDPNQQKEAFHYTNLQPLWARENMKKGKKIL